MASPAPNSVGRPTNATTLTKETSKHVSVRKQATLIGYFTQQRDGEPGGGSMATQLPGTFGSGGGGVVVDLLDADFAAHQERLRVEQAEAARKAAEPEDAAAALIA